MLESQKQKCLKGDTSAGVPEAKCLKGDTSAGATEAKVSKRSH